MASPRADTHGALTHVTADGLASGSAIAAPPVLLTARGWCSSTASEEASQILGYTVTDTEMDMDSPGLAATLADPAPPFRHDLDVEREGEPAYVLDVWI